MFTATARASRDSDALAISPLASILANCPKTMVRPPTSTITAPRPFASSSQERLDSLTTAVARMSTATASAISESTALLMSPLASILTSAPSTPVSAARSVITPPRPTASAFGSIFERSQIEPASRATATAILTSMLTRTLACIVLIAFVRLSSASTKPLLNSLVLSTMSLKLEATLSRLLKNLRTALYTNSRKPALMRPMASSMSMSAM